jgi:ankyrin repeat protein
MNTANPAPAPSGMPRRPMEVVLLGLVLALTAMTAVFATLYFTRTTPTGDSAQNADSKGDGKPTPIDDVQSMVKHRPKLAAFHEAVLAGQVPRAAELKEVDVDEPDEQGRTALMKAAERGNLRAAMFLIAMGAQFNQRNKEGKTALMHAAEKNQIGIIGIFRGEGTAPAEMAALRAKYHDASKGVAGKFELPNLDYVVRDNRGQTAFMQAMVKGYLEAAEKFFYRPVPGGASHEHNYDLEAGEGNTILHLLAADGNTSLVRCFEWQTINVVTPGWFFKAPKLFLDFRSSKLNQANRAGRTAWMLAAEKGHLDIVKHLLPNPPRDDLQHKDKAGKTGLDLARANNHKEVVAYLTKLQQDLP